MAWDIYSLHSELNLQPLNPESSALTLLIHIRSYDATKQNSTECITSYDAVRYQYFKCNTDTVKTEGYVSIRHKTSVC